MGLSKKLNASTWNLLREKTYPGSSTKNIKGIKIQCCCLGNICPKDYVMQEDWDMLSILLPRKRQKIEAPKNTATVSKTDFPNSSRIDPPKDSSEAPPPQQATPTPSSKTSTMKLRASTHKNPRL